MSELTIPGGKMKGMPIAEAGDNDIAYWAKLRLKELRADPEGKYAAANQRWLDGAKAELASRGIDLAELDEASEPAPERRAPAAAHSPRPAQAGARSPEAAERPAQQRAQRRMPDSMSFSDPADLQNFIDDIAQDYNLVGSVSFGAIPLGHAVVFSTVRVPKATCYKTDNGFGLAGSALSMIAGAAGVSVTQSVQTHYDPAGMAAFIVSVARQEITGEVRSESKSGQIDLRPGTKEFETMLREGEARRKVALEKKWEKVPEADGQIRAKLKHLSALTETKAYLRAVRKLLSLDRSFSEAELAKPFGVLRLSFTGRCPQNPEIEMMFARGLMGAALGGTAALFGRAAMPQLGSGQSFGLLGGAPMAPALSAPPITVRAHLDDDAAGDLGEDDIPY